MIFQDLTPFTGIVGTMSAQFQCLPNHLTVEKIRAGNSVLRNPILASYAAKGILPYRGLGTGIRRALTEWNVIDFFDDREACTFKATIRFVKVQDEPINGPKKRSDEPIKQLIDPYGEPIKGVDAQIVKQLHMNPHLSYDQLAELVGIGRSTVMRHVQTLKDRGVLLRVGPKKTGHWEVVGMSGPSVKGATRL
jgi:ATP-dependent DNA helicase RecG